MTNKVKGKPEMKVVKELYRAICNGVATYKSVGREFGVSDNAVRKWFRTEGRELPRKIQGQQDYICSECKKVFRDDVSRENDSRSGMHFCDRDCMSMYASKHKEFNSRKPYHV